MASAAATAPRVRALYRRLLRELPPKEARNRTLLSHPSPLQRTIRAQLLPPASASASASASSSLSASARGPSSASSGSGQQGAMSPLTRAAIADAASASSRVVQRVAGIVTGRSEGMDARAQAQAQAQSSAPGAQQPQSQTQEARTGAGGAEGAEAEAQEEAEAEAEAEHALAAAEQFVRYVQAQRVYVSLLERYNPGMNMDEEERVRLTARRVGMDLPEEYEVDGGGRK